MPVSTLRAHTAPAGDTFISAGNPTFNYGTTSIVFVGSPSTSGRLLAKLDLSGIPSNATIVSAIFQYGSSTGSNTGTFKLHRSLVDWFEGVSNAAVPGAGVNASTWNHRNANGSVAWSGGAGGGAGTDYVSTASATQVIPGSSIGPFNFDVTADVQGMVNGTLTNRGWWMIATGETMTGVNSEFGGTSGPTLVVTWKIVGQMQGTAAGTCTVTGTMGMQEYPPLILQPDNTAGIDTRILQELPTFNYGTGLLMSTGWSGAAYRRTLIKFDLSALPPGATIQRAAVVMYFETSGSSALSNNIAFFRSLVEWYEGGKTAAVPDPGTDGSTWNLRNANGSVAWAGGPGGQAGTEWLATPTDSKTIVNTAGPYEWVVTQDVQDFVDGTYPNHGWWILANPESTGAANSKVLLPSDIVTNTHRRPYMVIEYIDPTTEMQGSSEGVSTVTGVLHGIGYMHGSAAGTALVEGHLVSNAAAASAEGIATVTGTMRAIGYMHGSAVGSSTAVAIASARGRLAGSTAGTSEATASASFNGMLRGSAHGIATVTGTMWGKAVGKRLLEVCESTPLLYLTDGSYLPNGQLDKLDLLSEYNGFILKDWDPNLAQYKGGGYFSDSALGQGRRLSRRVFENAIEVMTLSLRSDNQNRAIQYFREYLRWQELAADYWTSDWMIRPVYMVARSGKETNIRYAIVHVMSIPNVRNPYSQPFFVSGRPAMEDLTLRIEREPWSDYPPGEYEAVPISSVRSYTVADWGASS